VKPNGYLGTFEANKYPILNGSVHVAWMLFSFMMLTRVPQATVVFASATHSDPLVGARGASIGAVGCLKVYHGLFRIVSFTELFYLSREDTHTPARMRLSATRTHHSD
jgi:hypothetical protein